MDYSLPSFTLATVMLALGSGTVYADTLHVPSEHATIQAAIDAAVTGDEVVVADGIYIGPGNTDISFRGKAITVRSANGSDSCTIDCQASPEDPRRGFVFSDAEPREAVLQGFTIMNGATLPGAVLDEFNGAAILCNDFASPTIRDVVLTNNRAGCWGGAMCCTNASPLIENSRIVNNQTDDDGGGFFAWLDSHPVLINTVIADNSAVVTGGGVANFGGGIITMLNCTIANNDASWASAGYLFDTEIRNSVIWGNTDGTDPVQGFPEITFSNVQGGFAGEGNINVDPQFMDALSGDYRLSGDSMSIDAGDNTQVPSEVTLDALGRDRFVGAFVDQGAYERQDVARTLTLRAPLPGTANTMNRFDAGGAISGDKIYMIYGLAGGKTGVPGCSGLSVNISHPIVAGAIDSDANGFARFESFVPDAASGRLILLQAVTPQSCEVSARVDQTF